MKLTDKYPIPVIDAANVILDVFHNEYPEITDDILLELLCSSLLVKYNNHKPLVFNDISEVNSIIHAGLLQETVSELINDGMINELDSTGSDLKYFLTEKGRDNLLPDNSKS